MQSPAPPLTPTAEPTLPALLSSGLLVSLIVAGALVRLYFGGLDGGLASLAGVLAGALFVPVGCAQLAARRLVPRPRRVSGRWLHGAIVPWAAALAAAGSLHAVAPAALAALRSLDAPPGGCASVAELAAARWSFEPGGPALLAGLADGRKVRFELARARLGCRAEAPVSRR